MKKGIENGLIVDGWASCFAYFEAEEEDTDVGNVILEFESDYAELPPPEYDPKFQSTFARGEPFEIQLGPINLEEARKIGHKYFRTVEGSVMKHQVIYFVARELEHLTGLYPLAGMEKELLAFAISEEFAENSKTFQKLEGVKLAYHTHMDLEDFTSEEESD